jgi:hypothetical protein
MYAISSAYALAQNTGRKLTVIWELDQGLNAPFESLFQPISGITVISKKKHLNVFTNQFRKRWPNLFRKYMEKKYGSYFTRSDMDDLRKEDDNKPKKALEALTDKDLYIEYYYHFVPNTYLPLIFKPLPQIQNRIEKIVASFSANTIGLQIRRTDNIHAIKNSPIHLFTGKMDMDILSDEKVSYFLATDSPEVVAFMQNKYSGRIINATDNRSRNSREGVKQAVVDLYCLSRTSRIYGSYGSTFSDAAHLIGNIPIEILKLKN